MTGASEVVTAPAPLLRLAGVTKSFPDGTDAVAGVDLVVRPGELVAVVGPSGCGKSTLLHLVAGLARPSGGTLTRATDRVGYVFQDPTLLPWRTVRRNVELFGELADLPRAERRRRAERVLAAVGLTEFADHRPGQLSGGMRMRAALARALLVEPELFLFDEPFAALDEITRQDMGEELLRLFDQRGFGAIFVTHSVAEAVYLASRVLVMSARPGRVLREIEVAVAHPRRPEFRRTDTFATLVGEVSEALAVGSAR
ncbi:ABC transporter ATP-binding protein [Goodfellowiella coeruleoviolacea]|uniref:NitT/TauT family transport system ATP-binding protein n=1 Tax=Goodfellowiella coeruleoviolacea TaxID=334858 RepID=A0AAE3KEU8_9PSEU|nr:ABC transporter ATP-binding protein [Goodfellowiella coeruleoviolacea]MCP2163774.1 NitT/TauT family transport system ATP-binding protein [Goodfellowiella coeruleoviolacea]